MSKVKLGFGDLFVELCGAETNEELSTRALNMLAFLVQEKLRYDEFYPAEEEDCVLIPPEPNKKTGLPVDVLKAYL